MLPVSFLFSEGTAVTLDAQTFCLWSRDAEAEGILQSVRQHMCLPLPPRQAQAHSRSPLLQGSGKGGKGAPHGCALGAK